MLIAKADISDVPKISAIHVQCWREVYHFMPESVHQARPQSVRQRQWVEVLEAKNPDDLLLKICKEDVVGFAFCKRNTDGCIDADGELTAAYLLPDARGGAIGPVLMNVMLKHFLGLRMSSACLWVFDDNPIRYWYRAVGWKEALRRNRVIAGQAIPEAGLVCRDLNKMTKKLSRMSARAERAGNPLPLLSGELHAAL